VVFLVCVINYKQFDPIRVNLRKIFWCSRLQRESSSSVRVRVLVRSSSSSIAQWWLTSFLESTGIPVEVQGVQEIDPFWFHCRRRSRLVDLVLLSLVLDPVGQRRVVKVGGNVAMAVRHVKNLQGLVPFQPLGPVGVPDKTGVGEHFLAVLAQCGMQALFLALALVALLADPLG